MDSTKTLHIVIDPSGAQTGGRVVSRTIDDISKSAVSAKAQMKDLADAQQQAARSAQSSAVVIGQQQDALRAKFNPTFAVIQRYKQTQDEIRMAHRLGALSVNEMTSALSRERQAALSSIEAIKGYSAAMNSAATARRTLRSSVSGAGAGGAVRGGADQFGTANLAAQFQDIAVTSAMGMSPLQIALQQGTQLSAVLGPMGAAGAVRGLGAAFLSIVNPVSLVTLGLVAGTAALIQYFSSGQEGAKEFDALLSQHAENIKALEAAYGQAAAGLKLYQATASGATLLADTKQTQDNSLAAVLKEQRDELDEVLSRPSSAFDGNIKVLNQFRDAVAGLKAATDANKSGLIDYVEALSKIAVSDDATESQKKLANTLRGVDKEAMQAARTLPAMMNATEVASGKAVIGVETLFQRLKEVADFNVASIATGARPIGAAADLIKDFTGRDSDLFKTPAFQRTEEFLQYKRASRGLRELQTELDRTKALLAQAGNTPAKDIFGIAGSAAEAQGVVESTVTSINKIYALMDSGAASARSANEGIERIREELYKLGGDRSLVDNLVDGIVNANLRVRDLEASMGALGKAVMSIPNRIIDIGIRQYTVGATGGGTKGINVYGSNADMTQQSYDIGGKTITVTGGNGYYGSRGQLVEQSDIQGMYTDLGYGGARAAGGPVVGGKQYLVGENGPELVTMGGAGNVTNANSTASILSGGRDTLSLIEDHLYSVMQELRIHTGYWETAESNASEMIACLQAIKSVQSTASYSSGGSSSGGGSSRSGGYGSSSSGNRIDDPMSPYYFNARRANLFGSGAKYSPVADALLNGNINALSGVSDPPNTMGAINKTGPMPSLLDRLKHQLGFATGGQIMPGEDQRVEFFKKNTERVIIVDDAKVSDGRGQQAPKAERPIVVNVHFQGGDVTDRRSQQAMADQFRRAVQQVARS